MKKVFVGDLKKGDSIFDDTFAIKSYKRAATRNNKPYIDIELVDKTGSIKGKIWSDDMARCMNASTGDIVAVSGTIEDFQGRLQFKLTNLNIEKDFDIEDFLMKSKKDIDKMYGEIEKAIMDTKNPHIRKLLENIFSDDQFATDFKHASAAYTVHHNYVGGLLEHTNKVVGLSDTLSKQFPKLNKDVLIAGSMLHDIGKMQEFDVGTAITITKEGKLLGHIFLGSEYVKNKADKDMPSDLLAEVLHLILSHHGELQFGSPIVPMTAEAVALAMCDRTSSQTNMAYYAVHEGEITDEFTQYHRQLGTELYRSPYLNTSNNEDIPF